VNEHLTRRDALVAALAATALGGRALARPMAARAAASVNIGVILPLSHSPDVDAANNILTSARLWADWVNGRGGVLGRQVAIKLYDSRADPARASRNLVHAVTKDGCSVILAGWDSNVALAEIRVAHQYKVPMFVAYAWSPDITKANYPEVVRIGPYNNMLPNAFAPFMTEQNYRHVAVISEDTAFGKGLSEAIRATGTLAGISMTEYEYPRDTHDLRPTLKKVLPSKPDAIVLASHSSPALYLAVTQARAAGYKGDIVLGWDYVDDKFWKAVGKRGVGVIWPTFSAPPQAFTPAGLTFRHLFTKKYKRAPIVYQAFTWDELSAWKWAAETAGSIAPADVIPVLPRIDMQGTLGHITLSNKPGTLHFNQWEGIPVFFDQATKTGVNDSNAKLIASIKGQSP
jgi:ABC-type branched-subunit amino acid transport system substrate-binding protein